MLEDELLVADTATGPGPLIDRIYQALLFLVNRYMTFDFENMYVYWPTDPKEPAQIRRRIPLTGIIG